MRRVLLKFSFTKTAHKLQHMERIVLFKTGADTLVFPAHIFNAESEYGKLLLPHLKKIWQTGDLHGLVIWQLKILAKMLTFCGREYWLRGCHKVYFRFYMAVDASSYRNLLAFSGQCHTGI